MLLIHAVLDRLKAELAARPAVVLVAPPGAGKTTVVPLELIGEPWAKGRKILVLEPRRLAARAASERMAHELGEQAGQTVGYRVRMQSKVSAVTRVEVLTEGVFTRMILDDPGLDGAAAVLFDEFHERSLEGDLGLALARDVQSLLRPELKLLVMSATLDGARVAELLDGAPVVEGEGRQYPVDTRYLGRDARVSIEEQTVRAIAKGLKEESGGLLVFLPGQGEIRRVERMLAERQLGPGVEVTPLYGALDLRDQNRAIAPSPPGKRKVVLATSIAETSLTIDGVSVVIDCGLSRVPKFDPSNGLTRLETVRVSRAAADQRRGRAGRTAPGVCYRLWDEAETRALVPFARPEILEADLSGFALDLARWGARDPSGLAFLDTPPAAAFQEARALLGRLGALDRNGEFTPHGRALAELPLPPRLAHLLLAGAEAGDASRAARIAMLLTERGLGGSDTDLRHRLEIFDADRSPRARDARALADRWARAVAGSGGRSGEARDDGLLLAEAYPERIAKARGRAGEFLLAGGRGAYLDPTDALAREPWLAVGELGGGAARDRILVAAPVDEPVLRAAFADRLTNEEVVEADSLGRLKARRRLRLGALVLEDRLVEGAPAELISRRLLGLVREKGLSCLPWNQESQALRARIGFLHALDPDAWPDLSDEALLAGLDDWLEPLLAGRSSLAQIDRRELEDALRDLIGWKAVGALEREAPAGWTTPAGTRLAIDYGADGGPRVEARVQELYGLDRHPTIAGGRVPLTLALLSPARRPIQITRDLPGFWRGSWKPVRTEMRGRYPKHIWPEDPEVAAPTTRAKPRA